MGPDLPGNDGGANPFGAVGGAVAELVGLRFATLARRVCAAVGRAGAMPGRRTARGFFALVACTASIVSVHAAEPRPNARLAALFESEYRLGLREHPESATYNGVHDYDDRLTDLSVAAIARRKAHVAQVVAALERFDPRTLNRQDVLSRRLMLDDARRDQAIAALYGPLPFDGLGSWLRISPSGGPLQSLVGLSKAMPFATTHDYDNYLKRLAAFPERLSQDVALMRTGIRSGWMPPRAIMARVPSQFEAFVVDDVTASPLYRPFQTFGADIPAADRTRLAAEGRRLLAEVVRPAAASFRSFVVDEYLPACTDALAASSLPAGERYYALAAAESTTTTLSPAEIHRIGLDEVARIGTSIDALIGEIGADGTEPGAGTAAGTATRTAAGAAAGTVTRAAFFDRIRADPRFYYTSGDDMLRDYRDIAKRVDAELPKLFATLPRLPYGVRAMEAYEGDNAEHYTAGALDGSRAGYFEANVLSLSTRPRYDMENTFLHEAVPGHHLQIARAAELQGLPTFRRDGSYTAYVEGWALYAESLGAALGMYRDPYSRFSALSWEMVRACRLVIDTGIHAFGWTREQSIRYMMDNAGLQRGFATAEIDRYIASPGQALGYKIGELKIKALRDRAKAALGDRFDLRRFHDVVLDDGALTLTLLEARVDEWIAGERRVARLPATAKR